MKEPAAGAQAAEQGLALRMHGGVDHLDARLRGYRVFLNPSTSDVVATTSAEALAMGKWLLCPAHASNAFFAGFANCLVYRSPAEFARQLRVAEARGSPPNLIAGRYLAQWSWLLSRFAVQKSTLCASANSSSVLCMSRFGGV